MQEKILNCLRKKSGYVSGEEISRHLGISRQALWKHTQDLKEAGYDIIAVPHLGYKLLSIPDRLYPFEVSHNLATKIIGKRVYYFDTTTSTNDLALHLGMENAPEGTLVVAETQTKGRGRLGRRWESPKYKGVYFSVLLRPAILPNSSPVLTLLVAVSVCEAVRERAGLDVRIKWPNDIVLNGHKLGGILTELKAEMDAATFIVIGVGLNVNTERKDLVAGATSLKEQLKEDLSRVEILQAIVRRLEANYVAFTREGSASIVETWRRYAITLGKRVKVICQKTHLEAEALAIDADGGLLVRTDNGQVHKIYAGDIVHCR